MFGNYEEAVLEAKAIATPVSVQRDKKVQSCLWRKPAELI